MSLHRNAKLALAGRYALVCAIEGGMTLKAAAAAFSVSPATAHRWWHRWLESGDEPRRTLSCLCDRSSRPHRSPRQLAPELAEAICACRLKTGWGRDLSPEGAASGWALPVLLGQRGSRPKAVKAGRKGTPFRRLKVTPSGVVSSLKSWALRRAVWPRARSRRGQSRGWGRAPRSLSLSR
jgi:transposase-like protein